MWPGRSRTWRNRPVPRRGMPPAAPRVTSPTTNGLSKTTFPNSWGCRCTRLKTTKRGRRRQMSANQLISAAAVVDEAGYAAAVWPGEGEPAVLLNWTRSDRLGGRGHAQSRGQGEAAVHSARAALTLNGSRNRVLCHMNVYWRFHWQSPICSVIFLLLCFCVLSMLRISMTDDTSLRLFVRLYFHSVKLKPAFLHLKVVSSLMIYYANLYLNLPIWCKLLIYIIYNS